MYTKELMYLFMYVSLLENWTSFFPWMFGERKPGKGVHAFITSPSIF